MSLTVSTRTKPDSNVRPNAMQEAAELRRQLRAASAARGEVECLEREIVGLTRDVDLGAAAQRDVVRLEREVGDLKWKLEHATDAQQEAQTLREELDAVRSALGETRDGGGNSESAQELRERLNVAEVQSLLDLHVPTDAADCIIGTGPFHGTHA